MSNINAYGFNASEGKFANDIRWARQEIAKIKPLVGNNVASVPAMGLIGGSFIHKIVEDNSTLVGAPSVSDGMSDKIRRVVKWDGSGYTLFDTNRGLSHLFAGPKAGSPLQDLTVEQFMSNLMDLGNGQKVISGKTGSKMVIAPAAVLNLRSIGIDQTVGICLPSEAMVGNIGVIYVAAILSAYVASTISASESVKVEKAAQQLRTLAIAKTKGTTVYSELDVRVAYNGQFFGNGISDSAAILPSRTFQEINIACLPKGSRSASTGKTGTSVPAGHSAAPGMALNNNVKGSNPAVVTAKTVEEDKIEEIASAPASPPPAVVDVTPKAPPESVKPVVTYEMTPQGLLKEKVVYLPQVSYGQAFTLATRRDAFKTPEIDVDNVVVRRRRDMSGLSSNVIYDVYSRDIMTLSNPHDEEFNQRFYIKSLTEEELRLAYLINDSVGSKSNVNLGIDDISGSTLMKGGN